MSYNLISEQLKVSTVEFLKSVPTINIDCTFLIINETLFSLDSSIAIASALEIRIVHFFKREESIIPNPSYVRFKFLLATFFS